MNFNFDDDIRIYFFPEGLSTNNFCHTLWILSVKQTKTTLMHNTKMDRTLTKVFTMCFKFWRYFLQAFRTSFNIIWKKYFCHRFSVLTDLLKPYPRRHPHPLNSQIPLSVKGTGWLGLELSIIFTQSVYLKDEFD